MSDVRNATDEILSERPTIENEIRHLLEVDDGEPWTFDDVSMDSGNFGEIVSRGIVEPQEEGYRIVDRRAVSEALDGPSDSSPTSSIQSLRRRSSLPDLAIEPRVAAGITGAIGIVLLLRILLVYDGVFRNGDVVLLRNDPYFYRYWIERLLASDLPAFSVASLGNLPGGVSNGNEVLYIVSIWWASALVGGDAHAAGLALAWYPVVVGVLVAVMTYSVTTRISKDRRTGIAAVLVMAVLPVSVQRLGLGFADHHAFDMIWLALGLLFLTRLSDDDRPVRRRTDLLAIPRFTWVAGIGFGFAIAAQVLSWRGSVLLVLPVVGFVMLRGMADVQRDRSPVLTNAPLVAGLLVGTVGAIVPHLIFGWLPTTQVLVPAALCGGALAVLLGAEAASRIGLGPWGIVGAEIAAGGVVTASAWMVVPGLSSGAGQITSYFRGLAGSGITETISLVGPQAGVIWGLIFQFGFLAVLILPYIGWGIWATFQEEEPLAQLPVALYAIVFLGLAMVQLRFALQLSLPMSVLGGIGVVHLASEITSIRPPNVFLERTVNQWRRDGAWEFIESFELPTLRTAGILGAVFLLITGFALVTSVVATGQLPIDDESYRTAEAIDRHADERGLPYPGNYVLSDWGLNRMYNYVVNGQSRSYGYARGNYESFLASTDPATAYRQLRGKPVGYVVTTGEFSGTPDTMQVRLHEQYGSRVDGVSGLGHYRVIAESPDGSTKAFAVVPGAMLTGTGPPNATATIRTDVSVSATPFTYERQVRTNRNGTYTVTVSYPGTYEVFGQTYRVNDSAIGSGGAVGS